MIASSRTKDLFTFYFNKFALTPFVNRKYKLCFNSEHRYLWFRVAKSGSRTINKHLKELSGEKHLYTSPIGYCPSWFRSYFKFAFVRNPIERFCSAWRDKALNSDHLGLSSEEQEKVRDLDYFIDFVGRTRLDKRDFHFRPQHTLIDLNNIDFIGRNESFNSDIQFIFERLGAPIEEVYHENRTKKKEDELTDEQRKRIARIYEMDLRLFYPGEFDKIFGKGPFNQKALSH